LKKLTKKVIGLTVITLLLLAFSGMGFAAGESDYTVLIYLNGTDLESAYDTYDNTFAGNGTKDLNEMIAGYKAGAGVNVIVQTGGTQKWANDFVSASETQRFKLTAAGFELVESMPNQNMGYKKTLSDFIVWGNRNYPAKRSALILWNHGAGPVNGYGHDELFEGDSLHLEELEGALKDAKAITKKNFEVLGFDACLMASVEVADIVKDYAKYLVASEELEPGHGWNYKNILMTLTTNPAIEGKELATVIVDSYYQHAIDNNSASDITLSVIDLSNVDNVLVALEVLIEEAALKLEDEVFFYEFAKSALTAKSFGGNTEQQGYTDIIDMKSFANHLMANQETNAQLLIEAIDKAVIYKVEGTFQSDTSGLSIYFPYRDQDFYEENMKLYNKTSFSPTYKAFLKNFREKMIKLVGDGSIKHELVEPSDDNEYFQLVIDENDMKKINYVYIDLYALPEQDDQTDVMYKFLGTDFLVTYDETTNSFYEDFGFYWTFLDSEPLMTYVVAEYEDLVEYESPVLYNGEAMNLKFAWVNDVATEGENIGEIVGGHYEIYGLRRGIDPTTGMPDKNMYQIAPGDQLTPLYEGLTEDGREVVMEGKPMVMTANSQLSFEALKESTFQLAFRFVDFSYNVHQTDFFEVFKAE